MNKNYTTHHRFKAVLFLCFLFLSSTFSFSQSTEFRRIQKVVAGDRSTDETFGYSVSISGDFAAVGCPYVDYDENGLDSLYNAGAVYILERNSSGVWIEVAKLTAPNRAIGNNFGCDVDLSGSKLIVGQSGDDFDSNEANPLSDAGSVVIFERNGSGNWVFTQKITATVRAVSDYFGYQVSISGDRAIISSPYNTTDELNANPIGAAGAVFAFEKNISGIWTQIKKIVEPNRYVNNQFGLSLDISDNFFVIGSPHNTTDGSNLNPISDAGSAYVYQWNASTISFFHKIVANDRKYSGLFGSSVTIEGSIIAVGARGESYDEDNLNPVNFAGAIYTYSLAVSPFLAFHYSQKLVAPDRSSDTQLAGMDIDIKNGYVIASSLNSYDNSLTFNDFVSDAGSAYIFNLTIPYTFVKKLTANVREMTDYYGRAVAIGVNSDGMVALVNCNYDDEDENEQNTLHETGSVFFYDECISSTNSITVTSCNNYEFHGSVYTASGTYVDTIPNAIGCDSLVTINLSIYAIDTTLSYLNGFVQSNQGNATYQWINCQTGLAVPGATGQFLNPPANGLYKVVIYPTSVSCSDTSECVFINNVGIGESTISSFSVYPNPSSKDIMISGDLFIQSLSLQSLNGELVQQVDFSNNLVQTHVLDVSKLTKGIYFLRIITENSLTEIVKISIQ
jgi:Secretion system C-terminal sorting domain/FG-GAP repeat